MAVLNEAPMQPPWRLFQSLRLARRDGTALRRSDGNRGFSRWVCEECGSEKVVASSCKRAGWDRTYLLDLLKGDVGA